MKQVLPPAAQTEQPASLLGLAILTMLILGVSIFLYSQRPPSTPSPDSWNVSLHTALDADLPGFRRDTWFLPDDDLLGFVEIPAGPFLMGSNPAVDGQAFDNERWMNDSSEGLVDLPTFYIGRYEVTVAQFATFVQATGHNLREATFRGALDHPVSVVSWPDSLAYCRWLERTLMESSQTPLELKRVLASGGRVTLPNEAQWEKAARGHDGRIYPWGSEPRRDRANYGGQRTTPVGSYPCPECPFDLFDMAGNVWEWTRSPYQPYPFSLTDDRDSPETDALWIMRGGSFADPARNARAATRGGADPGARRPFIGFRIVISKS